MHEKDRVLVGICGKKGSGKTSVARCLAGLGAVSVAFADPLYDALSTIFGVSVHELQYPEVKNKPHDALFGVTPRHALQTLGTEWGRQMIHPDLWVLLAERRIHKMMREFPAVIVHDVRFDNEAKLITSLGGEVWRITRPGLVEEDQHASEAGVSDEFVTRFIVNKGTIGDLYLAAQNNLRRAFYD